MPDDRTVTLESLFDEPRFNLSKDKLQQLDTLRRIRNNILHGFETLFNPVEAAALVAASTARRLGSIRTKMSHSKKPIPQRAEPR